MASRRAPKHTPNEIAEILESDDEFPDSYDETPCIPVYQIDNRFAKFEPVEFNDQPEQITETELVQQQITTTKPFEIKPKCQISLQEKSEVVMPELTMRTPKDKKILISKGFMSKRDIFLIKSIEEYATDATMLWFIDFLNYKAKIPQQRSCLVPEVMYDQPSAGLYPCSPAFSDSNKRYHLKIVTN